jgi:hypothetical protein
MVMQAHERLRATVAALDGFLDDRRVVCVLPA